MWSEEKCSAVDIIMICLYIKNKKMRLPKQLPYFSIVTCALSIQKRSKFVKNEHARYTLERYER